MVITMTLTTVQIMERLSIHGGMFGGEPIRMVSRVCLEMFKQDTLIRYGTRIAM